MQNKHGKLFLEIKLKNSIKGEKITFLKKKLPSLLGVVEVTGSRLIDTRVAVYSIINTLASSRHG